MTQSQNFPAEVKKAGNTHASEHFLNLPRIGHGIFFFFRVIHLLSLHFELKNLHFEMDALGKGVAQMGGEWPL